MTLRTPALVLLLAACTSRPPPDAPGPSTTGAPASTPPDAPVATAPAEPVIVPLPNEPEPPPETPPANPPVATADPQPLRTPPPPANSPAAITVAIASVQLSANCPDEPSPAAPEAKPSDAGRASQSRSSITREEYERQSGCQQSTLQLALTNTGGRSGKLHLEQVRVLDGKTRRVLGTLPSRKPSHWRADAYQPWDEQIAGNTLTQASYRLGDVVWKGDTVFALTLQPYFVEIAYTIDGHKKITRSAEIVPRSLDMIET